MACEIDVDAYIRILTRYLLPLSKPLFPGILCTFLQDNVRPPSAHITKPWVRRHKVCVWLAYLQSRLVSYWKYLVHHDEKNGDHRLLSSSSLVYRKNGELFQLLASVPKQLRNVIKRNGDVTKWSICLCPNSEARHQFLNLFLFTK